MTSWGSYDSNLRVGIDWTISPASPSHSDTSVTVTWKFYVGASQSFSDNESLTCGGTNFANSAHSFNNNLSGGGSMLVWTHSETYDISYNSGSVSANCNLTGAYNGGTPSKSVTVNLPNRPIGVPSSPTFDSPAIDGITQTAATVHGVWGDDNGGAPATTMQCQYDTNSSFSSPQSTSSGGPPSVSLTGLAPGTTYYVRLRTQNSAGWSDWSGGTRSFTTQNSTSGGGGGAAATVPGVPGSLEASSSNATQELVSWADPSNGGAALTQVEVQCATDSGFSNVIIDYVSGYGNGVYLGGLNASTTYYWRVRAQNSVGWGSYSAGQSFTTSAASSSGSMPQTPDAPSVTKTTSTTASVSFFAPGNGGSAITSYDFQWSTSASFSSVTSLNAPATQPSPFTITGLLTSTIYYVRFRANNAYGNGAWSAAATFQTQVSGSDGTLVQKINSAMQQIASSIKNNTPAGEIKMWGGTSVPTGFLLCNGQAVSRSTYSRLFNAIGTHFGSGDGSTTFNVPNLCSAFPIGAAADGVTGLGASGGSAYIQAVQLPQHAHTTPNHSHSVTASTSGAGGHFHGINSGTATGSSANAMRSSNSGGGAFKTVANPDDGTQGAHSHTVSGSTDTSGASLTGYSGSGEPYYPPYVEVNFLVKF